MDAHGVQGMRREWVSFVNSLTSFNLNAAEFDPQSTGKRASPYVSLPHNRTLHEYVWDTSSDARHVERYLSGGQHGPMGSSSKLGGPRGMRTQTAHASTRRRPSLRAHPLPEDAATSSSSSTPQRPSSSSTYNSMDKNGPRFSSGSRRAPAHQSMRQPSGATRASRQDRSPRSSSLSSISRPKDPGVVAMSKALMHVVYYHPGIPREQAEELMKGHPPGTFLLRDAASNHRGFSLSAIDETRNIRHFRVCLLPTNKLQIAHCCSVFDDMQSLIEYYQTQNISETTAKCIHPLARYFQVSYD